MAQAGAYPFRRFRVIRDGLDHTRVEWELEPRFGDPRPHWFTLQVAPSSAPDEAAWVPAGLEEENAFALVDDRQHDYGKSRDHSWRLLLTTPRGRYVSTPVAVVEGLDFREWRLVRELIRQGRKRSGRYTGVRGFLLKRRRYGPPCTRCIDPYTGQPRQADCPVCYGTGFLAGYYRGVPGLYADLGLESGREQLEDGLAAGTSKPVVVEATVCGWPEVGTRDVFCEERSGRRWFLETIKETSALRGFPYQFTLEWRQAPFSDPVYQVPTDGL